MGWGGVELGTTIDGLVVGNIYGVLELGKKVLEIDGVFTAVA